MADSICGWMCGWQVKLYDSSLPCAITERFVLSETQLECEPMPNVMAALLIIGGALCSTPQSLADPTTRVPCSNAAKMQNR